MSAVEVIAEALHHSGDSRCPCTEESEWWCSNRKDGLIWDIEQAESVLAALKAAGFVVATRDEIRAMSPSEQAELMGGQVVRQRMPGRLAWSSDHGFVADASSEQVHQRVVGPWRELIDADVTRDHEEDER